MPIEGFALIALLPPLAYGPVLPPDAFAPPRALVCEIHDLGRLQEPEPPRWSATRALDPRNLRPTLEPYLVNRAVDTLLFLGAAVAGRATWADDRPGFNRTWQATTTYTPPPIPSLGPPGQ